MRTAYDFSPLYRSMIGVDRMAHVIDTAMQSNADTGYPPYDIEKLGEDGYRITLAVAGFGPSELEINAQPNLLVVSGQKAKANDNRAYLHRGIAGRDFERRFELADYIVVKGRRTGRRSAVDHPGPRSARGVETLPDRHSSGPRRSDGRAARRPA